MKIIALFIIMVLPGALTSQQLTRVEPLTPAQKKRMDDARKEVEKANKAYTEVKQKIADEHGMRGESWMEWSTWVEFDGDFILMRSRSNESVRIQP